MASIQLSHQKCYNNTQGITIKTQHTLSENHHQMKMFTDNNTHCQMQFNNKNFVPSRNSQITSKRNVKNVKNVKNVNKKNVKQIQNSKLLVRQINNNHSTFPSRLMTSYVPPKGEVPAHTLFTSGKVGYDLQSSQPIPQYYNNNLMTQEQSQFRQMSFESSSCYCCKSSPSKSEESEVSQYFVVKLPGMERLILVPKCTVEKSVQQSIHTYTSSPTKMRVDQSVTVKLPGMIKNPVLLCEEPWWLSSSSSSINETVVPSRIMNDDNDLGANYDEVVITEEKFESAREIKIQLGVTPVVKLPSWSSKFKLTQGKEFEWSNDYFYVTTSNSIEFDNESPVVQLHPKSISSPRYNLPNLKIETSIKIEKDDDEGFLASAACSTLSTPISDIFSNISTYAESESTVFAEEEIPNEIKNCDVPERRSPSVLSDFGSELLTPVLEEEEEEESKVTTFEKCQEETVFEKSFELESVDVNIPPSNERDIEDLEYQEAQSEDLEYQEVQSEDLEYQEDQSEDLEYQEAQVNEKQSDYILPELREIAEQLKNLRSDSNEAIRIRRQIETIDRDNYPDYLPLSNKWTMYFADTSVTKTNTRVISKNKYSSTLNPIFECATVPELCSNLREFSSRMQPNNLKTNVNLSFFKGDIMPMWEDKANFKGGRFTFCPQRSQLNDLWNSIVLLLAGETIDDSNVICGAVCARRDRGDRVELWIRGGVDSRDIEHIRNLLIIELGHEMVRNVKYKKHAHLGRP